jgi:hypothetical protein
VDVVAWIAVVEYQYPLREKQEGIEAPFQITQRHHHPGDCVL